MTSNPHTHAPHPRRLFADHNAQTETRRGVEANGPAWMLEFMTMLPELNVKKKVLQDAKKKAHEAEEVAVAAEKAAKVRA